MALEKADIDALGASVAAAVSAAVAPLISKIPAPTKTEAAPEKIYSRAELDAAVDAGQITAIQASDILDQQSTKQMTRLARDVAREEHNHLTREQTVERDLSAYEALVPDVLTDGSKERAKVKKQFDYLVGIGQPSTKATELVALGMVYGPLDTLKAAKRARPAEDFHEEVGGGGADEISDDDEGAEPPKDLKLSKDQMRFYRDGIQKGIYKDWTAVKAEVKFSKPKLTTARSRMH